MSAQHQYYDAKRAIRQLNLLEQNLQIIVKCTQNADIEDELRGIQESIEEAQIKAQEMIDSIDNQGGVEAVEKLMADEAKMDSERE